MRRFLFTSLILFGTTAVWAQEPARSVSDTAKLASAISGSYYHPDDLSGLDCSVSIDWDAFFRSLKTPAPPDLLKDLGQLKVHTHAVRNQKADITFDWAGGAIPNQKAMEDGLQQMLGGFYEFYWPIIASSPISGPQDLTKIETLPAGK